MFYFNIYFVIFVLLKLIFCFFPISDERIRQTSETFSSDNDDSAKMESDDQQESGQIEQVSLSSWRHEKCLKYFKKD